MGESSRHITPWAYVAVAALVASSSAPAAPVRQPIKKWVVDFGETYCTASRTYGTEEQPLTLAFRPSPAGTLVRVMLARPGRVHVPHHFDVSVSSSGVTTKSTGLRFASADNKLDVIWITLERAALNGLRTAGEIEIDGGREVNERFALPQIGAVLEALDQCNQDLRKHWNADPSATSQSAALPTAVKPLDRLFTSADYPTQAIREGAVGSAEVTLMIDEKGSLKDCTIESTSGIASLDAMTCGILLQRAKFKPALDPDGNPIRSIYCTRITWRIADYSG